MDGYIRASGFVLDPYVFVVGPKKHDCSRRTGCAEISVKYFGSPRSFQCTATSW